MLDIHIEELYHQLKKEQTRHTQSDTSELQRYYSEWRKPEIIYTMHVDINKCKISWSSKLLFCTLCYTCCTSEREEKAKKHFEYGDKHQCHHLKIKSGSSGEAKIDYVEEWEEKESAIWFCK